MPKVSLTILGFFVFMGLLFVYARPLFYLSLVPVLNHFLYGIDYKRFARRQRIKLKKLLQLRSLIDNGHVISLPRLYYKRMIQCLSKYAL